MLSPETLERYRRMTPGERLALTLQMTAEAIPYFFLGRLNKWSGNSNYYGTKTMTESTDARRDCANETSGMNHIRKPSTCWSAFLERMSIEYAVMGGLAVRAYSIPRATYDIDFTIALEHERLPELFNALEDKDTLCQRRTEPDG